MSKSKFLFVLFVLSLFAFNVSARVCFLPNADGSENCGETSFSQSKVCPGCSTCLYPKKGAVSCDCPGTYKTNDCCSGDVVCSEDKICLTAGGSKTDGCLSDKGRICPSGSVCSCPARFKYVEKETITRPTGTEICSGAVGGDSCTDLDGITRWTECTSVCSGEICKSPQIGGGKSCIDAGGNKRYEYCSCPTGWLENCDCGKTGKSCTDSNGNTFYECKMPKTCQCGEIKTGSCVTGCTDDGYTYIGDRINSLLFLEDITGVKAEVCSSDYCCAYGYWDSSAICNTNSCVQWGYTQSSCSGAFVACPCDASKKKCLN